jgi:hypothetical protein
MSEDPSGTLTEETSEDIEEAELNEAWDLNAAEDALTEYLADEEEYGGTESRNPFRQSLQ